MTPRQRDRVAVLEYLLDQATATLPFSALCGYDMSRLGAAAAELTCLHPVIGTRSAMFQLYAEPDCDMAFTLTGEIDAACADAFATTIRRTLSLSSGHTVRVAADGLDFIGHEQLYVLDRQAGIHHLKVVLRTDQPIPIRLVDVLGLGNVRVERGRCPRTDDARSARHGVRPSKPPPDLPQSGPMAQS